MSTISLRVVFAELLRAARSKAGVTQEDLAVRAKLTREYISLLENGKRTPTITVFIRLARALGASPSDWIRAMEKHAV